MGRDRESQVMAALIESTCGGGGGAVVVRGEPGIGKTTLLVQAQQWAKGRAMQVLVCRGVQAESNLPFAGLHQLLRPILGTLPQLAAHQARLLRVAFGSEEIAPVDFYRVAMATLELLTTVAADGPVLIAADDAHWIDRPSTDVLAFVARRVAADPLAIVIAVREGTDDPFAGRDLPQLILAPLDGKAAESLLARVAPKLPDSFRDRLLHFAAGNPLALIELPASVHEWGPSPDRISVGKLLETSFATRTESLPKSTRALLLAVAAGPNCNLAEVCAAATAVQGLDVRPADIQPAIDARLVTVTDDQVVFSHPLMGSAIYQSANIGERLATHTALANSVSDVDRRVWHRAAAAVGHDDTLAADLEAVAETAVRRGAVSVSVAALDRAASLTSDRTRRADTLLRASERAVDLGRPSLALDLAGRAEQDQLSALGEARMMIVEDGVNPLRAHGRLSVPALIRAAVAAHRAGDIDLAAAVLWTAAKRCYWTSGAAGDRAAIDAALQDLNLPVDNPRRIGILSYIGSPHHRGELQRALSNTDARPDDLIVLSYLGCAATNLGDNTVADFLLGGAVAEARRQGRLGAIPRLQVLRAWTLMWSAPLNAVTVAAGEAERLADELNQPMWHGAAVLERSLITGLRGDYLAAKEQVRVGLLAEGVRGMPLFHAIALHALGVAALGVGEYLDAYKYFRRILDPADSASHYAARQWVAGDLVEAALRAGHLHECGNLLMELGREWHTDPPPQVLRGVLYAKALVGPEGTAEGRFDAALAADPGIGDLDSGRLQLAYGMWLRRQQRAEEAQHALEKARDLFDHLGMAAFARRADRELRAAGGVSSPRHGVGRSTLTPQELQIAQLAANGLSNRQIAEQLFLSHRTVGSHLYHVFPKLGVTTRSDLTGALNAKQSVHGRASGNGGCAQSPRT